MLRMTYADPGLAQPRPLTAIDFVRVPRQPEPPPRREPPAPPKPPQDVPRFELSDQRSAPLQLSRSRLPGLGVPALSVTEGVLGTPFLGDGPMATPPDQGLRIVQRFPPSYPARALMRKTEGWVRLELIIDREGRVADARVLEAEAKSVFDRAALKAARRWRFHPAAEDGGERPLRVTQKIEFKLER